MIDYSGKVLMITGGTGSFGNAVLERFLNSDIKEISKRVDHVYID